MGRGHVHALHVHGHSLVHRLPPHVKVVAAVGTVAAVAVTPREAVWAFLVHGIALALVVRVAGLPLGFVASRALVVAPFLVAALLLPFVASGPRTEVFGIELATEGLWGAWGVAAKATLGVVTSITLAATTEVPRLLRGLERLRIPVALTQIATFMVRYLEVIAGEVHRQRLAMAARGYDPRWLWQARAIGASAGTLFIRAYERGERVHGAMLARGFTGEMPDTVGESAATPREWALAACLPAVAASTAVLALLGRGGAA